MRRARERWIADVLEFSRGAHGGAGVPAPVRRPGVPATPRPPRAGTRCSWRAARAPNCAPRARRWAIRSSRLLQGAGRQTAAPPHGTRSRFPRRSHYAVARWNIERVDALIALSLGVVRESGDGGGEDGAARPDRRGRKCCSRSASGCPASRRARRRSPTTRSAISRPGWRSCRRATKRSTAGSSDRKRWKAMTDVSSKRIERPAPLLRVGIGGPVGSGKTALTLALCRALRDRYDVAVVTNDIYTEEDAQFLVRNEALAPERIIGVETGGCPHTAIREDASINLEAVDAAESPLPGPRSRHHRVGRRQSRGDLQPRAVGPDALRDRRRRRRQDPAQGRPGHHQVRSARHQQDRPRAHGRSLARGDGPRRAARCAGSGLSSSPISRPGTDSIPSSASSKPRDCLPRTPSIPERRLP